MAGLIVLRIWRVDKASAKHSAGYRRPTLKHISFVLVESGLLYTATAVIALAIHLAGSNAITPMADIVRFSPLPLILFLPPPPPPPPQITSHHAHY